MCKNTVVENSGRKNLLMAPTYIHIYITHIYISDATHWYLIFKKMCYDYKLIMCCNFKGSEKDFDSKM